jgi:hypothetical protein
MVFARLLPWFPLLGGIILQSSALAEQGTIRIVPRVARGEPLTLEMQNFSKLPVKVTDANLGLAEGSCTFRLREPVTLGPAEIRSVELVGPDAVARCLGVGALASTNRLSLRPFDEPVAGDVNLAGKPTILDYTIEINGSPHSGRERWRAIAE